jgi:hypothetical protein
MSIDKQQIPSSDFIKNEIQTLGFIKAQTSVANSFPELCAEASSAYSLYTGKHKKSAPTSFDFGCELKMEIENATRSLFIEVNVQQNYSLATYALSMCDSDIEGKKLIRKFHFDYDPQGNSSIDKKPKYHLQYGGKTTPKLQDNGISAEPLHDWLSVPRLSISPINLALLLDMVFNEFPSEETKRVIEKSEWRNMVKTNEDKILVPYFTGIGKFISGNHKSTCLFRDFAYGE